MPWSIFALVGLLAVLDAPAAAEPPSPVGGHDEAVAPERVGTAIKVAHESCHCPCKLDCSTGATCDCTMHPGGCRKCKCTSIKTLQPEVLSLTEDGRPPSLVWRFASWLEGGRPEEVVVTMVQTDALDRDRTLSIPMEPSDSDPSVYVPTESIEPVSRLAWNGALATAVSVGLGVSHQSDPGTLRIVDGDLGRLNEPHVTVHALVGDGRSPLPGEFDTLREELVDYLRVVTIGLEDDDFAGEPDSTRARVLSAIDAFDLFVRTGRPERGRELLRSLVDRLSDELLDPAGSRAPAAVCGFRKVLNVLSPGEGCVE